MAGGIWEAIGAALQQGAGTYNAVSQQQQAQRQAEERLRLQQEQEARQAEYQGAQLAMQRRAFDDEQKDRQIRLLQSAIEGAQPGQDLSSIEAEVRSTAPHLLSRLNIQPGSFSMNATQGLAAPSEGNPLGLSSGTPAVQETPGSVTRQATLQEQAAQLGLETSRADLARNKKIMDALEAGKLKDTPANRALLAQFTNVNPNEVWGSIEHPSRMNARGGGGVDALAQAVMENPALFEQMTPTQKGKLAPILSQVGFDFSRGMNASGIKYMSEAEAALKTANELKTTLTQDDGASTGPIQGYAGLLPDWNILQQAFGTRDVKIIQANIDLVKQRIGKLLEGGVLRLEDEKKYQKILPTVYDSPEVQQAKMENVIRTLENDIANYAQQQQLAGRKTGVTVDPTRLGGAPAPQLGGPAAASGIVEWEMGPDGRPRRKQ